MKQLMREIFTRALLFSGTPAAIRALLWRDRTAILLYHDPSPATLEAHFEYLKDKVEFVPLSQANSRGSGRPRVAVTFDDGHIGNANLLPVFIKYGVYPTIYVCSSVVAHDRTHWFLHPVAKEAGVKRLIRMTGRFAHCGVRREDFVICRQAWRNRRRKSDSEALRHTTNFSWD